MFCNRSTFFFFSGKYDHFFFFFRIFSGPKTFPGVFIETVRPGGLAEDYGLALGDQIVKVNGKSFIDIKHEEVSNESLLVHIDFFFIIIYLFIYFFILY